MPYPMQPPVPPSRNAPAAAGGEETEDRCSTPGPRPIPPRPIHGDETTAAAAPADGSRREHVDDPPLTPSPQAALTRAAPASGATWIPGAPPGGGYVDKPRLPPVRHARAFASPSEAPKFASGDAKPLPLDASPHDGTAAASLPGPVDGPCRKLFSDRSLPSPLPAALGRTTMPSGAVEITGVPEEDKFLEFPCIYEEQHLELEPPRLGSYDGPDSLPHLSTNASQSVTGQSLPKKAREAKEEEAMHEEMDTLYQIRLARRRQIGEREERRQARREARDRNDIVALQDIRDRAGQAGETNQSEIDELRAEHERAKNQRQRAVSSVSYADLGFERHDSTRIRPSAVMNDLASPQNTLHRQPLGQESAAQLKHLLVLRQAAFGAENREQKPSQQPVSPSPAIEPTSAQENDAHEAPGGGTVQGHDDDDNQQTPPANSSSPPPVRKDHPKLLELKDALLPVLLKRFYASRCSSSRPTSKVERLTVSQSRRRQSTEIPGPPVSLQARMSTDLSPSPTVLSPLTPKPQMGVLGTQTMAPSDRPRAYWPPMPSNRSILHQQLQRVAIYPGPGQPQGTTTTPATGAAPGASHSSVESGRAASKEASSSAQHPLEQHHLFKRKRAGAGPHGGGGGGDGSDSDGDEGEQQKRPARVDAESAPQPALWACPFVKWKPVSYAGCHTYTLKDISRVKQHLRRRHKIPLHCPVCGGTFGAEAERDAHLVGRSCRPPEEGDGGQARFEGVTIAQQEMLERRVDKRVSKSEQWYSIYSILFPDQLHPSSPYVDTGLSLELRSFETFLSSEGMAVIRSVARQNIPAALRPQESEVLAFSRTLFEHAIPELLQRYHAAAENVGGGGASAGNAAAAAAQNNTDGESSRASARRDTPSSTSAGNAARSSPSATPGSTVESSSQTGTSEYKSSMDPGQTDGSSRISSPYADGTPDRNAMMDGGGGSLLGRPVMTEQELLGEFGCMGQGTTTSFDAGMLLQAGELGFEGYPNLDAEAAAAQGFYSPAPPLDGGVNTGFGNGVYWGYENPQQQYGFLGNPLGPL